MRITSQSEPALERGIRLACPISRMGLELIVGQTWKKGNFFSHLPFLQTLFKTMQRIPGLAVLMKSVTWDTVGTNPAMPTLATGLAPVHNFKELRGILGIKGILHCTVSIEGICPHYSLVALFTIVQLGLMHNLRCMTSNRSLCFYG